MARTRPRWTFPVVAFLGAALIRLWRLTWRIDEVPQRCVAARRGANPGGLGTIYLMWHSGILLGAGTQAGNGLHVLISLHGDGEYIARTVERLGFHTIRGSTTRGGARALMGAVETLRAGADCALTPDGPKGPRLRVQQGCVAAASITGAPIVPVAFACRSARRLRSWDRFIVPWFFTKVAVRFGDEIHVPPGLDGGGLDDAELETWRARVEDGMHAVHRDAAAVLGTRPEAP